MYFLETNYTQVHRGIIKKNSKILSTKICKKLEAGDHICMSNSDTSEIKDCVRLSKNHCSGDGVNAVDVVDKVDESSVSKIFFSSSLRLIDFHFYTAHC